MLKKIGFISNSKCSYFYSIFNMNFENNNIFTYLLYFLYCMRCISTCTLTNIYKRMDYFYKNIEGIFFVKKG